MDGTVNEKYRPTPCSGTLASTAQDRRKWGEEIKDTVCIVLRILEYIHYGGLRRSFEPRLS